MPHRDPETGQFVSDGQHDDFERFEEIHDSVQLSVPAADVGGQTGQEFGQEGFFEGVEIFDFEGILDRDEIGVLLWAEHRLVNGMLSTATADGTLRTQVEISASPSGETASFFSGLSDIDDTSGDFVVESSSGGASTSADLVGRSLLALAYGPITDGTNGVGGAGTAGTDEWVGQPVAEPVYDVRDSLFLNGVLEHSNVDDDALYSELRTYWVVGIQEV